MEVLLALLWKNHIALLMIVLTVPFHTHSSNVRTSHAQYNCRAKAPRGFEPFIFEITSKPLISISNLEYTRHLSQGEGELSKVFW